MKITKILFGFILISVCLFLSCSRDSKHGKQGNNDRYNKVFVALGDDYLLNLYPYKSNHFEIKEYWHHQVIYSGYYELNGDTLLLTYNGKEPKKIGKKLLFAREGIICFGSDAIIRYNEKYPAPWKKDTIMPFKDAYQLNPYFKTKFSTKKLYGKWYAYKDARESLTIREHCWIKNERDSVFIQLTYDNNNGRLLRHFNDDANDTSFFQLTYDSQSLLKEKFKTPFIAMPHKVGCTTNIQYFQILQLNDTLMYLAHYYKDYCPRTHIDYLLYKRA